ncbi:MAG: four helix bundle protein [Bacteroidota bacterium]
MNIARRSVYECAYILIIFERRDIITPENRHVLYRALLILSRKITNFRKTPLY